MKKFLLILLAASVSVFLSACDPQQADVSAAAQTLEAQPDAPVKSAELPNDSHNSENSLDWGGVYEGKVPGANSAINVKLVLDYEKNFELTYCYLGKGNGSECFNEKGAFRWNETGNTIMLDVRDWPPHYRVGERHLTQLDMEGNPITGELAGQYVLEQTSTAEH